MEIPSSHAGVVKELKVKLGDKVGEGSLVLVLEAAGAAARRSPGSCPAGASATCAGGCGCAGRARGSVRGPVDVRGARHRRLRRSRGDRGLRQARRQRQGRAEPDHGRERQGLDGDPVVARRRGEGLKVKVGDKVRQGELLIAVLQGAAGRDARRPRRCDAAVPPPSAPAAPAARGTPAAGCDASARARQRAGGALPHASPSIRRLARELGVPLAEVKGSGPKGRITQARRARLRQGRDGGRDADRGAEGQGAARAGGGRWRFPGLLPWPQGGLHQVRPDRAQGPVAHQEDQRRQPAPQLGGDSRMSRTTTTADITDLEAFRVPAEQGEREVRHQGHDARLPDQGLRRRAEEVPRFQRQPRSASRSCSSSTSTSVLRPTRRTAWWCR